MYRSKRKSFMEGLKTNVLAVTVDCEKEDRKYALDKLRIHVRVDDLHQYAVRKFPGKNISFGIGTYGAPLVIVTKNPILKETKGKLEKAWEKMNIPFTSVYYAHLRFVPTKKKQDIRDDIFQQLLKILSPKIMLVFDNIEIEADCPITLSEKSLEDYLNGDADSRKALTQMFKEVRPLIL